MIEKISLTELYLGRSTYKKDVRFESAKTYIKPFLNTLKNYNYILKIYITRDSEKSVYNKILIQAILDGDNRYKKAINLTYSIDTSTPILKIYRLLYDSENDLFLSENFKNIDLIYQTSDFSNIDYDVVYSFINEDIKDPNIDLNYSRNRILKNIGKCMEQCEFTSVSFETLTVALSGTLFYKIILYICQFIKENYSFIELYTILYKAIMNSNKDISNQYEKLFIVKHLISNYL